MRGGVLCSEMEASALFVVASILRKRAGAVMMVAGNQERPQDQIAQDEARGYSLEPLIRLSITALEILIKQDRGEKS